jgi:hypothetical protein
MYPEAMVDCAAKENMDVFMHRILPVNSGGREYL